MTTTHDPFADAGRFHNGDLPGSRRRRREPGRSPRIDRHGCLSGRPWLHPGTRFLSAYSPWCRRASRAPGWRSFLKVFATAGSFFGCTGRGCNRVNPSSPNQTPIVFSCTSTDHRRATSARSLAPQPPFEHQRQRQQPAHLCAIIAFARCRTKFLRRELVPSDPNRRAHALLPTAKRNTTISSQSSAQMGIPPPRVKFIRGGITRKPPRLKKTASQQSVYRNGRSLSQRYIRRQGYRTAMRQA